MIDILNTKEKLKPCVSVDWLEVYCLESNDRYPCDADYFRTKGYFVNERDYGTRQYAEMFTIEDEHGEPWIEIRRNPMSGQSEFSGLNPMSTHIRLVNRHCYFDDAVERLRNFLTLHDYIFKRIFRIDICRDFEYFDSGDDPAKFCRRYLANKYAKINQCHLSAHGADNWSSFDWETLSWGSRHSMVGTKLYNKTKELQAGGSKKPWIVWKWYLCGLIDNPVTMMKKSANGGEYSPTIWRLEFSLRSQADNWIVIENQSGKKVKRQAIPHKLSLFDSPDKLWQRFQELSFHYFRFKKMEEGKRKDRCKDKVLFYWDRQVEFMQVSMLPREAKPNQDDEILRRKLQTFREKHCDQKIRVACEVILDELYKNKALQVAPREKVQEVLALRLATRLKFQLPEADFAVLLQEATNLVKEGEIW